MKTKSLLDIGWIIFYIVALICINVDFFARPSNELRQVLNLLACLDLCLAILLFAVRILRRLRKIRGC
jgi:hypothetical protein